MDHNGFERKTRHSLRPSKWTWQTQLHLLRDVIVQIFPLPYGLFREGNELESKFI